MQIKAILTLAALAAFACATIHAAGPGGDMGAGGGTPPGGEGGGGGTPPGGESGGGESGGGGSSGSFEYDSFISVTTNANCLVRGGVLYGCTSSLAASVAPTSASAVSALACGVFAGNTSITAVDLSGTAISAIPSDAFSGCTGLATVVLPASCTAIGANAFAGCSALSSLTASGVTEVGADAFNGCSSLAAIPTSVVSAGGYAFAKTGLTSVDLDRMSTLGDGVFSLCSSLASASGLPSVLPAALFAGNAALSTCDMSGCDSIGDAAFAGCESLASLSFSSSASLGAYAFAADTATVSTLLEQSSLPSYDAATTFLGREVSYTPASGSVTRIEARDLVDWLSDATASSGVTQPADYSTETLKTWLDDPDNAYAYAYADDLAADADFVGLTVSGTNFVYNAPSDSALSISVTPVACYTLSAPEDEWSADNLVWSEENGAYVAADGTDTCFARLRFICGW